MEQITFSEKQYKKTKASYYVIVEGLAKRLDQPVGQWLKLLERWPVQDIVKTIEAAENMALDTGKPFGLCWQWMYKHITRD